MYPGELKCRIKCIIDQFETVVLDNEIKCNEFLKTDNVMTVDSKETDKKIYYLRNECPSNNCNEEPISP